MNDSTTEQRPIVDVSLLVCACGPYAIARHTILSVLPGPSEPEGGKEKQDVAIVTWMEGDDVRRIGFRGTSARSWLSYWCHQGDYTVLNGVIMIAETAQLAAGFLEGPTLAAAA